MAGVVGEDIAWSLRPEMESTRHLLPGTDDVSGLKLLEPVGTITSSRVSRRKPQSPLMTTKPAAG